MDQHGIKTHISIDFKSRLYQFVNIVHIPGLWLKKEFGLCYPCSDSLIFLGELDQHKNWHFDTCMSESVRTARTHWMPWCRTANKMGLLPASSPGPSNASMANWKICSTENASFVCNILHELELLYSNCWILWMQSLVRLAVAFRQALHIVWKWVMPSSPSSDFPVI